MVVLAAILLVVAYNMDEWAEIPELWKQGWTDRLVWLVTFALTVLADLTVAVLKAIEDFADAVNGSGRALLLCGAPPQPAHMMERAEFHRHVGADNILPSVDAALRRAEQVRPTDRQQEWPTLFDTRRAVQTLAKLGQNPLLVGKNLHLIGLDALLIRENRPLVRQNGPLVREDLSLVCDSCVRHHTLLVGRLRPNRQSSPPSTRTA